MTTILITGGTGLIGHALTKALAAKGYHVIILTRDAKNHRKDKATRYSEWNIEKQQIDPEVIQKADCIVHLAGANIAGKRWTKRRKKEITDSRVKSGELLVKFLKEIPNQVKVVISASAIGYYGADQGTLNSRPFVESDSAADGFLSDVVQQWEGTLHPVTEMGKRLVIFRQGIVLSKDGGAFQRFEQPVKFRVSPILGSGKQIISWIHIDDLVRLYIEAIENESMKGIYNAVSPYPVSNREFMRAIGAERGKLYVCIPVPEFFLKLFLGKMSIEVLKSATVGSQKIQNQGFLFIYPTIETAVRQLMRQ